MWPGATIIGVEDSEIDCQLQEGMEAKQKRKRFFFWYPAQKKTSPGQIVQTPCWVFETCAQKRKKERPWADTGNSVG